MPGSGWTPLPSRPGGASLDYIRANLFDPAALRLLPPDVAGPDPSARPRETQLPVMTPRSAAAELSRAAGGPTPIVTGEYRLGDVRHITASSERLRAELGWAASVSFEEGMLEFATAPLRAAVL